MIRPPTSILRRGYLAKKTRAIPLNSLSRIRLSAIPSQPIKPLRSFYENIIAKYASQGDGPGRKSGIFAPYQARNSIFDYFANKFSRAESDPGVMVSSDIRKRMERYADNINLGTIEGRQDIENFLKIFKSSFIPTIPELDVFLERLRERHREEVRYHHRSPKHYGKLMEEIFDPVTTLNRSFPDHENRILQMLDKMEEDYREIHEGYARDPLYQASDTEDDEPAPPDEPPPPLPDEPPPPDEPPLPDEPPPPLPDEPPPLPPDDESAPPAVAAAAAAATEESDEEIKFPDVDGLSPEQQTKVETEFDKIIDSVGNKFVKHSKGIKDSKERLKADKMYMFIIKHSIPNNRWAQEWIERRTEEAERLSQIKTDIDEKIVLGKIYIKKIKSLKPGLFTGAETKLINGIISERCKIVVDKIKRDVEKLKSDRTDAEEKIKLLDEDRDEIVKLLEPSFFELEEEGIPPLLPPREKTELVDDDNDDNEEDMLEPPSLPPREPTQLEEKLKDVPETEENTLLGELAAALRKREQGQTMKKVGFKLKTKRKEGEKSSLEKYEEGVKEAKLLDTARDSKKLATRMMEAVDKAEKNRLAIQKNRPLPTPPKKGDFVHRTEWENLDKEEENERKRIAERKKEEAERAEAERLAAETPEEKAERLAKEKAEEERIARELIEAEENEKRLAALRDRKLTEVEIKTNAEALAKAEEAITRLVSAKRALYDSDDDDDDDEWDGEGMISHKKRRKTQRKQLKGGMSPLLMKLLGSAYLKLVKNWAEGHFSRRKDQNDIIALLENKKKELEFEKMQQKQKIKGGKFESRDILDGLAGPWGWLMMGLRKRRDRKIENLKKEIENLRNIQGAGKKRHTHKRRK